MNQEKYNLDWHTFPNHLREMLQEMMKSKELTDVTLVCDDKRQIKAHKIVLSACSSVFKSIITDLPQNSSVIYLRGIQHQEMESILEFMYLGVATFYQDRMNEFLNVAKNLEIKEISKDLEFYDGVDARNDEPEIADHEENTEVKAEPQKNCGEDIDTKSVKNKHEGMGFACNQCNYQATQQDHLTSHIKSIHKGVKYACNQCDQQFTQKSNLTTHIKSKHEGVKYACNQCDQQFTLQSSLSKHIKSIHEGVRVILVINESRNS